MKQISFNRFKTGLLCALICVSPQVGFAGLAVNPGVSLDMLDQIDEIQDEGVREMLRASVWPGFGGRYMNLDRPDEELSVFERNYKSQPLNWDQKIENVKHILDQADDLSTLTEEQLEYKDIVFGEAVIPAPDRRVTEILNTIYLEKEIQLLLEEKQAAMADLYNSGRENIGLELQRIEDEYAIKLATLMQAENAYKEAKIDFLKLDNQKKYERITAEEYQQQTLEVVSRFEDFFSIGSEVPVFSEDKVKQLASSIYDDSIQIAKPVINEKTVETPTEVSNKINYWVISGILMLAALFLGMLGFRHLKKSKKKSNF